MVFHYGHAKLDLIIAAIVHLVIYNLSILFKYSSTAFGTTSVYKAFLLFLGSDTYT